jgi:7SK snRNA methylphosphate capping enzyme
MFGNRFLAYQDQHQFKDARLALILNEFNSKRKGRDLFEDKRILDIGCHTGALSMQIAAQLNPKIVIGVDIDHRLVKNAIENIHRVINTESTAALLQ